MADPAAEGVHSHHVTLPTGTTDGHHRRPCRTAPGRVEPNHRRGPDGGRRRWCQRAVIDGMRMLCARAARAELARSQSGSLVRRTNELCASPSAVHDVHVSRYEPPE
jgi:hypothetical protein